MKFLIVLVFSTLFVATWAQGDNRTETDSLPHRPRGRNSANATQGAMKPPKLDSPTTQGKRPQEKNAGRAAARPNKQFFGSVSASASTSFSGQFPWQASFTIRKGPFSFTKSISFCSGSLVDYNWLATSAYCAGGPSLTVGIGGVNPLLPVAPLPVAPLPVAPLPVVPVPVLPRSAAVNPMTVDITIPGSITIDGFSMSMEVSANSIFIHPEFNPLTLANDIALIRLPYPAPLPSTFQFAQIPRPIGAINTINTILLPKRTDAINTLIGRVAIVSGWANSALEGASGFLSWANSTIISNLQCANYYGSDVISGSQICLDNNLPSISALCQGDSGSPLVIQNPDGTYTLQGIESFGPEGGCTAEGPLVFTRVSNYLNWISRTTGLLTP